MHRLPSSKSKLSHRALINKLAFKADFDKSVVKSFVKTLCNLIVNNLILDKNNPVKSIYISGLGIIEAKYIKSNNSLSIKLKLNEKNKAIIKNMY